MYMDYQELIEKLTNEEIIEIMEELGAEASKITNKTINFTTICHCGDSQNLVYYDNSELLICYTGQCKNDIGNNHNIISMVQLKKGIGFSDAIKWILNFLDGKDIEAREVVKKERYEPEEKKILPIYNKEDLSIYEQNFWWSEWAKEGITYDTIVKYQIGSFVATNSIIIPVFDIEDNLVGVRQRHTQEYLIEKEGKYRPLNGYEFPSSATLYGINISKDNIRKSHKAILFEGEKSVMKYDSLYEDNISVAVFGSSISMQQIDILKSLEVETVVLAFDKDYQDINSQEAYTYRQKLDKLVDKLREHFNVQLIWDTEDLLGYKDSPIDKGKEIFDKLLDESSKLYKSIVLNKIIFNTKEMYSFEDDKPKREEKYPIESMEKHFEVGKKFKAKLLWDEFGIKSTAKNSKNSVLEVLNSYYKYEVIGHSILVTEKRENYEPSVHGMTGQTNRAGDTQTINPTNIYANMIKDMVYLGLLEDWQTRGSIANKLLDTKFYNRKVVSQAKNYIGRAIDRLKKYGLIKKTRVKYMAKVGKFTIDEKGKEILKMDKSNLKLKKVSKKTYEIFSQCRNNIFKGHYSDKYGNLREFISECTDEENKDFNIAVSRSLRNKQENGLLQDIQINNKTEFIAMVWEEFILEPTEDENAKELKPIRQLKKTEIQAILRLHYLKWNSEEKLKFNELIKDIENYSEVEFGINLQSFEDKILEIKELAWKLKDTLKNPKYDGELDEYLEEEEEFEEKMLSYLKDKKTYIR